MSRPGSDSDHAEEWRPLRKLPRALDHRKEILRRLAPGRPFVCLDYDGTLTPVAEHPDLAELSEGTREVLRRLARRWPVAVVSGRDAEEVRRRVGIEGIHYAGNHGLEMLGPRGRRETVDEPEAVVLDRAAAEVRRRISSVDGAWVERKRFGLAVHFRQADPEDRPRVLEAVHGVATGEPSLRATGGKQVVELRPDVGWDKGRAVERLVERVRAEDVGKEEPVVPVYVGDDITDEDGFEAVRDSGIGIAVRGEDDDRPTRARYSLAGPEEVRTFLSFLLESRTGERPGGGGRSGSPPDEPARG